ncbi:hypothetical protein EIP86_000343 [Pleurotus ostreatoroseus]|nr:hypothetical protein EIP86_000343 [Pleurotus ostreatoroseus]
MSMVGYIVGLGDRHGENILIDKNTGDVVHIDFDCLFEKGQKLTTPERVPFRLTQNVIDGFGVTGVEGAYRITSEISMELLRRNKDCLRAVLDAFIHDPLTQWSQELALLDEVAKNKAAEKLAAELAAGGNRAGKSRHTGSLKRIDQKLDGVFLPWRDPRYKHHPQTKELQTDTLVDMLIREATNKTHLAQMYNGWMAWL